MQMKFTLTLVGGRVQDFIGMFIEVWGLMKVHYLSGKSCGIF